VAVAAPRRRGFPIGFALLLVVTLFLYAATAATVADSRSSDAAGNALSQAFAAMFGGVLWIAIAVLLVMARARGAMLRWAPWALFVLLPLGVVGFFVAIGRFTEGDRSALIVVFALPLLPMLYALWARFPALHATLRPVGTSAALLAMMAVLSIGTIAVGSSATMPNPKAQEARAAAEKARLEQEAKTRRATQEREAATFAALGPDSHLTDYLPFLHDRGFADQAMTGIQKVKTRQADAIALIEQRPLNELTELWQWNVLATREMCEAYANAFLTAANRITKTRSDYISAAIDLEWQMPNLKWLVRSKCDLSGPLERAETNIKAVADSDRLRNFANTLAEMKNVR
jgi:hypothetical protein